MARATAAMAVSATLTAVGWLLADVAQTQGTSRAGRVEGMAAFERVATVLESPRCLNCHPRSDRPSQGDDGRAHLMNVQRGASDTGLPAMGCAGCHQEANNDRAGVPGAPHWRLAPRSMGWTGLSRGELCRTLLDRSKNGGRSVAALVTHMTSDRLVLWAWQPGGGRTPPPLAIDHLKLALKAWVEAGTPCPP
jgi:hypothetical protein